MQWDNIIERIAATCKADPVLVGIYGDAMRFTGTGAHHVPMLEWMLVADGEGELWAPVVVQLDQWTRDDDALRVSERRLRQLFHREGTFDFLGLTCWGQYTDGQVLASPDRDGYFGKAARFRLTPLRERYTI